MKTKFLNLLALSLAFSANSHAATERAYSKVKWIFQCPANPMPVPQAGPNEIVVSDEGPLRIEREKLVGTQFEISGRVCKPEEMKRDLVFAVDVSGSMANTDAPDTTNKTCNRLKAISAVLDSLDWQKVQVSILTFDDGLVASSDRLYSVRADMEKQIVNNPSGTLFDIVCTSIGGTEYVPALNQAETLLETGGSFATKEIFLISDGVPYDLPQSRIFETANRLKNTGIRVGNKYMPATIATVMIGSDDAIMKQMASLDSNNKPIHAKASDSAQLNQILANMAKNNVLASSQLRHKGTTQVSWSNIDIMSRLNANMEFSLPPFSLTLDGDQSEYDLNFEYFDSHRNQFSTMGRIIWTD